MSESRTPYKNDYAEWLRNRAASPYFALARNGLLDSANAIERLESDLAAARAEVERLRGLAHELDGVIIDVKHGGFDAVCLQTVTRVRDALAAKEPT